MRSSTYEKIIYATVIPFVFIIVSPLTIFFGNSKEYEVGLSVLIIYLLLISLIVAVLLLLCFLIASFVKWESGVVYGAVVGLALSALVQSQLFVWDFGPLDGREIEWSRWSTQAIIEALAWIFICCFTVLAGYRSIRVTLAVAQWILAFGAISLVSAWMTSDYTYTPAKQAHEDNLFKFHGNNNKLLIIVDTWQSDVFREVLANFPRESGFLQGFTFFPDSVGGYPTTKASVPLILSGRFYENKIPFDDWVQKTIFRNNIVDFHAKRGFGIAYVSNGVGSSIQHPVTSMSSLEIGWRRSAKQVLAAINAGVFRGVPIYLKPVVYDSGLAVLKSMVRDEDEPPGFHGSDYRFMKVFDEAAHINSSKRGEFKIFHLRGAHYPLVLDEQFRYVGNQPNNRSSYVKQVRGTLYVLRSLLYRLKALGIYNDSQIVIVGDHGTMSIMPDDLYNVDSDLLDRIDPVALSTSRPVILYKPSESVGNLITSDKPMHLTDVVCLLSDWHTQFDCANTQIKDNRKTRRFLYYKWGDKYWKEKYLPPITEYNIKGDVSNIKSWITNDAKFVGQTED